MLFLFFRFLFGVLVFIACLLFIGKTHTIHKRWRFAVAFAAAAMGTTILALLPVENAFLTFSSPQSAYQYNHTGDVKLVVSGEITDFVVGVQGDVDEYAILPKSDDGWKLGMGFDTKRIHQTVSDGIVVYVYQYKNTDDYYITILDTSGGPLELTDNRNSNFQCLEHTNEALDTTFYTYYGYIHDYDDSYALTVK